MRALNISLVDMVLGLTNAVDLVAKDLANHHQQVAYIAARIAEHLNLPKAERKNILLAGALHDTGALSESERLAALDFDINNPHRHAEAGYHLYRLFDPFAEAAAIIRYHHLPWQQGKGRESKGTPVPLGSHIVHLADRVSVLIDKDEEILGQVPGIVEIVRHNGGEKFIPRLVEAFAELSGQESFWFDIKSSSLEAILFDKADADMAGMDLGMLTQLSDMFRKIIDYRCPFTANHSGGVAASAAALAAILGYSEEQRHRMRVAGLLHDLGKLAVPVEVLQKPGRLTVPERNIIKGHTYHTYRILDKISGLEEINQWASLHHETLDGRGYPFKVSAAGLSLGSRIMAVADVFTAISEDRPYRLGMSREEAVKVLHKMAANGSLDGDVVTALIRNYEEVNQARCSCQKVSALEYADLQRVDSLNDSNIAGEAQP